MITPPIPITITKYLKQSLYTVPLNPDLILTENDFIVLEAQDNVGISIPEIPIQVLIPTLPTSTVVNVMPSSTVVTIATATMATATSPSPTSVTTMPRFLLSPENWNLVLIVLLVAMLFVLMLTCLVCSCIIFRWRYRNSHLVEQTTSNDPEKASFGNNICTQNNFIGSSVNDLSLREKSEGDPYERPQSAIVTKTSFTSDDSLSPPTSTYNSMDVLVEQSARDQETSKL